MDMFQKLEKALRKIHQIRKNKIFLITLFFFLDVVHAQIDQRFDLFDWEIIRQNESINSISEGYQYIFFATDANGILRFNKFSRKFESSLYLGQGVKSNKIKHVYFDKNTGILWLVGNKGLEFSNSRQGNWNNINFKRLSINSVRSVEDIGSSTSFLWIKTISNYIKLDHVSGSLLGVFTFPDESNIDWGDINFKNRYSLGNFSFEDYFVEEAWLLGQDSAADNNGTFHKYNSYLKTKDGYSWIGLSNGQLLFLDDFSKTIKPQTVGVRVSVPLTISMNEKIWIGGINNSQYSSISSIENSFENIENFVETSYSGFSDSDFYSSEIVNDEVWFGSNGKVVVYNIRSDFFRTLGYEKGIPIKRIEFIEMIDQKVYIASSDDLVVLDSKSKKIINSPLADLIKKNNLFINFLDVFDNKLHLSLNGRVYLLDSKENINIDKYESLFNDSIRVDEIYGNNENLFFSSDRGIYSSQGDRLIPSSIYFNYKVNDALQIDNTLYIGTSGGLAVYDIKEQQLNNFYDFSFIRNIFKVEQVDEFLVLLTSTGLIKLRLSL